jgi:C-methyltransferase
LKPDPIFQLLLGYRTAAVTRAAIELDCFTAVAEGKRTAAAIAAARGGTERSIRILLDAMAAAGPGLLRKSGRRYALTPLARRYLVRTSREFVGPLLPLYGHRTMWDGFFDLPKAVRAGTSVLAKNAHASDQTFWEDFARATAGDAVPKARAMIRLLRRIPAGCAVLDLACGSGAYGATFARRIPGAEVTLLDRGNVLAVTRRLVDVPVKYLEGDLFGTDFGGPYDVVIASHVFHHFDRGECAGLARKIAGALRPGGRLVVQEFIPDEARSRKLQPLLFAVTMLVWTREGDAYALSDYRRWFADAGFRRVTRHPLEGPADVLIAMK